jgi:hypothetical protein
MAAGRQRFCMPVAGVHVTDPPASAGVRVMEATPAALPQTASVNPV